MDGWIAEHIYIYIFKPAETEWSHCFLFLKENQMLILNLIHPFSPQNMTQDAFKYEAAIPPEDGNL